MVVLKNKDSFPKCIFTGPVREVRIEAELGFRSTQRDVSLRNKYIGSLHLEDRFSASELKELYPLLQGLDLGHVVELSHGGTNENENLLWESKAENRSPGKKRQIETLSDQMLVSGKSVRISSDASFDDRLPFKAPYQWSIEQKIYFRNGRPYQTNQYSMGNEPYLAFATSPAVRRTLMKCDLKECTTEWGYSFAKGMLCSTGDSIRENVKTAFKVAVPHMCAAGIKLGLDYAQTSKSLPYDLREQLASTNINPYFNTFLGLTAKLVSNYILYKETNKKN